MWWWGYKQTWNKLIQNRKYQEEMCRSFHQSTINNLPMNKPVWTEQGQPTLRNIDSFCFYLKFSRRRRLTEFTVAEDLSSAWPSLFTVLRGPAPSDGFSACRHKMMKKTTGQTHFENLGVLHYLFGLIISTEAQFTICKDKQGCEQPT